MNDTEPSGSWREATSLFHAPQSNTVALVTWRMAISLSERLTSCDASLPTSPAVAATVISWRSAAICEKRPPGQQPGLGPLRVGRQKHFEQLPAEDVADQSARTRVLQDHGAEVLLGKPHRVTVKSNHVAAVMDDRQSHVPSIINPIPNVAFFPVVTFASRRASAGSSATNRALLA